MRIRPFHEGDSPQFDITVYADEDATQVEDITGATLAAAAEKDGTVVNATTQMIDAPNGVFRASFATGELEPGKWVLQARVTLGAKSGVVIDEEFAVRVSHV